MPRKKITRRKVNSRVTAKKSNKVSFASRFKWEESYTSLAIGAVVVILVIIGLVYFLRLSRKTQTSSTQFSPAIETVVQKPEVKTENKEVQKTYLVKSGESLWIISEKIYGSGYNWVDIAKANNLTNPSVIHVGNKLVIPNVAPKIVATTGISAVSTSAISGNSYTVVKGDYLWEIAVRAYGDGFAWVKIAKANKLSNPDLIHSGNVLKIPR